MTLAAAGPEGAGAAADPGQLARHPAKNPGAPRPLYCIWEITLRCDLGCKHCGSRAGKARTSELTTAECFDLARQLANVGVREVVLIGGEAYLRDDWHLIAGEITRLGMICGMATGARSLTAERISQATDAGMRSISISLDGLEASHDAQRGVKGSWRAAVDACSRVAASPIRLTTNSQVNRISLPELPALADLLVEVGSRAWQVQLSVAMGRAADRPDLLLQPYELLELFPLLVWIQQEKLRPKGILLFPGNNVGYFGPYEHELRYGGEDGAHWGGCPAGRWAMGVEADGQIKGCPSLPTSVYGGGNVRETRLAEIIANAPELRVIRERTIADLWGFCRTCYYADTCMGGCTWTAHSLLGRAGNNPYCIHRATELEAQGLRERIVKVEAAPGLPFDHGRYELALEPLPPPGETPSVGGVPLNRLMALGPKSGGAWTKAELDERLRPR